MYELENRLSRLYDALETGKLTLDNLAPRIKGLRMRQDELSKTRVVAEAEMTLQGNISILMLYTLMLRIFRAFLTKAALLKERLSYVRS
jgi:hypothetical protein